MKNCYETYNVSTNDIPIFLNKLWKEIVQYTTQNLSQLNGNICCNTFIQEIDLKSNNLKIDLEIFFKYVLIKSINKQLPYGININFLINEFVTTHQLKNLADVFGLLAYKYNIPVLGVHKSYNVLNTSTLITIQSISILNNTQNNQLINGKYLLYLFSYDLSKTYTDFLKLIERLIQIQTKLKAQVYTHKSILESLAQYVVIQKPSEIRFDKTSDLNIKLSKKRINLLIIIREEYESLLNQIFKNIICIGAASFKADNNDTTCIYTHENKNIEICWKKIIESIRNIITSISYTTPCTDNVNEKKYPEELLNNLELSLLLKFLNHPQHSISEFLLDSFDKFNAPHILNRSVLSKGILIKQGNTIVPCITDYMPLNDLSQYNVLKTIFYHRFKLVALGSNCNKIVITLYLPKSQKFSKKNIQENYKLIANLFSITISSITPLAEIQYCDVKKSFIKITSTGNPILKNNLPNYYFTHKGDLIYLVGQVGKSIHRYILNHKKIEKSLNDNINIKEYLHIEQFVQKLINFHIYRSINVVEEKGLFYSLIECASKQRLGFDITTHSELPALQFLFNDFPPKFIISIPISKESEFIDFILKNNIPFTLLGHVTKEELRIDDISVGFINDIIHLSPFQI